MSEFAVAVIILLISVFISAISQIMLKIAANRKYESGIKEYINPLVITSYAIFLVSTVLTMLALRQVPLSLQPVLESTSYIYVTVLGYMILKEKISKTKLLGLAIILIGIFVYSVNIA